MNPVTAAESEFVAHVARLNKATEGGAFADHADAALIDRLITEARRIRHSGVSAPASGGVTHYGVLDTYGIKRWTSHPEGVPLYCQRDPVGDAGGAYPEVADGVCTKPATIRVDTTGYASVYFCSYFDANEWLYFLSVERQAFRIVPVSPQGQETLAA